jgi:hypothetical protein
MSMAGETVAALHQEGNQLFEAGKYAEAARVFRSAVDRFQCDRRSDKASVEEFVKVAGNLCVCHHTMGDWNTCVSTARELLAIYPVIPKAYGAIGMCIVSRLLQQEAEQQTEDLSSPNMPPRSGEEIRRDARRYLVKLGGVLCTPDDAHTYLCRAVLLSEAALQVSLGPYLETAVRLVSEELLSAGLSLEREYGDGVLGELSAPEWSLNDVPLFLDTAPVLFEQQTIRVLDAAAGGGAASSRRVEELPDAEAEAILRTIREGRELAHAEAGAESTAVASHLKPPVEPIDFFLSRRRIPVQVCHAERGGIPRGLTLARARGPFAVGQHVQHPPPTEFQAVHGAGGCSAVAGPISLPMSTRSVASHLLPSHADPALGGQALNTAAETLMSPAATLSVHDDILSHGALSRGSLASAPESPPLLTCNACGRELNPLTLSGPPPTGCSVCNSVVYCSGACATAYRPRHDRYECALRVALQARVEALSVSARAAALTDSPHAPSAQTEQPLPAGEVVPGAGWDSLELHRRVLPLCITVYSGLQCRAPGCADIVAKVELGIQRRLVHCLPSDVANTLAQWVESGQVAALSSAPTDDCAGSGCTGSSEGGAAGEHDKDDGETVTRNGHVVSCSHGIPKTASSAPHALSALDLLHSIFFLVRLHSEDHPESRSSSFYSERLLLRHSCEPNCVWSETLHSILTSRYICKGEELTMAVADRFPQHWPWQIRQKWFVHHHGVPCQCARCLREGADLNDTRGTLSNALVEQLLTADILGHPCPTPAHQHPTHLFHKQVQRVVEQSQLPQRNVPALLNRIDDLRAELVKYVLPSHYLLEDLRRALLNVAEPEGQTATVTAEGQNSLLFWEALWSGAVPAKRQQIRLLPSVFECGRRRRLPPNQQRRRRRTSAVAGSGTSPSPTRQDDAGEGVDNAAASSFPNLSLSERHLTSTGTRTRTPPQQQQPFHPRLSGSDGDDDASKARADAAAAAAAGLLTPPRTAQLAPLSATKDFSSGRNVVDLFYGSYQTWYM